MLHGKIGGFMLGGIAAYLIIGKGFNTLNRIVDNVCEASKWRSYYRHGKDGNMVPPGYSSHTHKINDNEELVVEDNRQKEQDSDNLGREIVDVIKDKMKELKEELKAKEGPLEGQTEASEDDKCFGCEGNCDNCEMKGDADDSEFIDKELKDPLYTDDLYDGIRVLDPEDEGDET